MATVLRVFWNRIRVRLRRAGILGRLLWRTGPRRVVVLTALTVVQGLQPVAVILETGALVAAIPAAVRDGFGTPAGQRALLILALLGATFVAGAVLQGVTSTLSRTLDIRYAQELHDTVARATLGVPDLAKLEDPEIADEIAALEEFERADNFLGVAGNARSVLRARITGVCSFAILFTFAWWAPFLILIGWRAIVNGVARMVAHGVEVGAVIGATGMRRSRYLRRLAVEPAAAKDVRVFGLARWVVERFAESWQGSMRHVWRSRLRDELRIGAAVLVLGTAHLVVLGVLAREAYAGQLAVASLVVFVQAVLVMDNLGWMGDAQWLLGRQLVIAARVHDLEGSLPASTPPRPDVRTPAPVGVALDGVRFTYRGRTEPTLDGLTLDIPAGQSIAIVGENGAGKTTLIKLLCALYEPDDGTIRLDGLAPSEARGRVGVIFQDFVRYELSLRDNVRFGNLALTDDATLAAALHDAGAGELLEAMPNGLDTTLARGYEGGLDLSGGQWQKVALARALTAIRGGAGLLILDEPTANLDVRAETELFDRFLDLTRDTTTVLVSHRLASVRHADRIVVLERGRITEDGSHDELLRSGGTYARMFRLQAERFAATGAPDA